MKEMDDGGKGRQEGWMMGDEYIQLEGWMDVWSKMDRERTDGGWRRKIDGLVMGKDGQGGERQVMEYNGRMDSKKRWKEAKDGQSD